MTNISNKSKILYMIVLILFLSVFGLFWLDYIGLMNLDAYISKHKKPVPLVVDASDDSPSLIEREEFRNEQRRLQERIQELDKREFRIAEEEKRLIVEQEKIEEMKRGIELEAKKLASVKEQYSGYKKNVVDAADKLFNMPPRDSVGIMVGFDDAFLIDVLRQMDEDARRRGGATITPYLLTRMPKEKASRIMFLMTQL